MLLQPCCNKLAGKGDGCRHDVNWFLCWLQPGCAHLAGSCAVATVFNSQLNFGSCTM
jgi:hypothetical protein